MMMTTTTVGVDETVVLGVDETLVNPRGDIRYGPIRYGPIRYNPIRYPPIRYFPSLYESKIKKGININHHLKARPPNLRKQLISMTNNPDPARPTLPNLIFSVFPVEYEKQNKKGINSNHH